MPLQNTYRGTLARGLRVILPGDREITFRPPTIGQIDDCLALDPQADAPAETTRQRIARLRQQAQILFGTEHSSLTGELTIDQVGELVQAIYLTAYGIDPTDFLAVQKALREQRDAKRTAEELSEQIDNIVLELAARLKMPPADVKEMFLRDAVALYERLAKHETANARFDASLHGKELL